VELPDVPSVEYVYYGGACYEWGIIGWLLQVRVEVVTLTGSIIQPVTPAQQ
jgi:hypothetical protein